MLEGCYLLECYLALQVDFAAATGDGHHDATILININALIAIDCKEMLIEF